MLLSLLKSVPHANAVAFADFHGMAFVMVLRDAVSVRFLALITEMG